jgi:hypothetical protein
MKTKSSKPHRSVRKLRRIYYGPPGKETSMWWTVQVSAATKTVTINGNVLHALKALAGVTVGCAFSRMAADEANRDCFPHPVYLAAFTKSTAIN